MGVTISLFAGQASSSAVPLCTAPIDAKFARELPLTHPRSPSQKFSSAFQAKLSWHTSPDRARYFLFFPHETATPLRPWQRIPRPKNALNERGLKRAAFEGDSLTSLFREILAADRWGRLAKQ